MSDFADRLATKVGDYILLRRSLGYVFEVQAATLEAFRRFVAKQDHPGPLTGDLALAFVLTCDVTPGIRARRHSVLRRFAEYLSIFEPTTEVLDPQALPRSRATPPARILDDAELARLLAAALQMTTCDSMRGRTLYTLLGLLASTGLRSGEALRLDRTDVDLSRGILEIRRTKFRKDRLVPVHSTTCAQLRAYSSERDRTFPRTKSPAFFLSLRGGRLSPSGLGSAFRQARTRAGLDGGHPRQLRPHDLRHRFAITRLVTSYRAGVDVQAQLPLLATYLGHVRYSDTAYYISGTAELLGLAAERVFALKGGVQ
jgi:integrase